MSETNFPGFELRARREELALSITKVCEQVHISATHLEALESGCLEAIPNSTYAVGFLRSYCQFLKLDPGRFADLYRECVSTHPGSRSRARKTAQVPAPTWLQSVLTWGAISAVFIAAWVTWAALFRLDESGTGDRDVEAAVQELVIPDVSFGGQAPR